MRQTVSRLLPLTRAFGAGILILAPLVTFAQTSTPPAKFIPPRTEVPQILGSSSPVALPSCFDYYRFGSVGVTLSSALSRMNAGAPVAMDAYVKNENAYPIVDATVYVRVFKIRTLEKSVNGDDVVDYFPIAEHITLKAGEQQHVSFIWHIPTDADPGDYRMVPFVVQSGRFNLLGLTFTDDITGPSYNFAIANDTKGGARFDRTSARINGVQYRFEAFPPSIGDGGPVSIYVDAANSSEKPYIGKLTWNTYYWDGANPANQLDSKSSTFALGAHASTTLSYEVTDTTHSVYYVTATMETPNGSKSIAAFRFVRPDIFPPRIADVAANAYPLEKGNVAFVCFHSAGNNEAEKTHVSLSLETLPIFGLFSIPLATTHYDGVAPGALTALTIPAKEHLGSFQVVASVSQNGKLVDRVVTPYRCEDLGTCPTWLWPSAAVFGFIAALFLVWLLIRVRRAPRTRYTTAEHRSMVPPENL